MTAPMRTLLVDDEPLAIRRLEQLLGAMRDVVICGCASSCAEALEATLRERPDVVLLDIRMRDGSGFDYLARLPEDIAPAIIFVTAFDSHAVEAFTHNALDYVLKPIDAGRLGGALNRARRAVREREAVSATEELHEVIANLREKIRGDAASPFETEFWIRKNVTGFVRVPVAGIRWVAADDDYVRICTGEKSYLLRSTLSDLQSKLDPDVFVRIHRSTIVRRSIVTEFRRDSEGLYACLESGEQLRVGRVYAKSLRAEWTRFER